MLISICLVTRFTRERGERRGENSDDKETTLNASSVREVAAIQRLRHERENPVKMGTRSRIAAGTSPLWLDSTSAAAKQTSVSLKEKFIEIRISSFVSRTREVLSWFQTNSEDSSSLAPIPVLPRESIPSSVSFLPALRENLTSPFFLPSFPRIRLFSEIFYFRQRAFSLSLSLSVLRKSVQTREQWGRILV